jgi:hypothetical protein
MSGKRRNEPTKWHELIALVAMSDVGPDECLRFDNNERSKNENGQVMIYHGGTMRSAGNCVLRYCVGEPVGNADQSMHSCLTKSCVNPAHLTWGTSKQNAADMLRDGTRSRSGSKRKLTPHLVRVCRKYSAGVVLENGHTVSLTHKTMGRLLGVKPDTIGKAIRRETWKKVA